MNKRMKRKVCTKKSSNKVLVKYWKAECSKAAKENIVIKGKNEILFGMLQQHIATMSDLRHENDKLTSRVIMLGEKVRRLKCENSSLKTSIEKLYKDVIGLSESLDMWRVRANKYKDQLDGKTLWERVFKK